MVTAEYKVGEEGIEVREGGLGARTTSGEEQDEKKSKEVLK